jgi:hypothetical protein
MQSDPMRSLNCEEFERRYTAFKAGALNAEEVEAFVKHQQSCSLCRNFSEESDALRTRLLDLPKLETSPFFVTGLQREIQRLERGLRKPDLAPSSLPRFFAAATGFAVAVIVGFIVFRSDQPAMESNSVSPTIVAESQTDAISGAEETLVSEPSEVFFTMDEQIDTATHRLPEPAGIDSFPIPMEDDLWQINQVSTTPGGN